jgi:hypothetical protein
MSPPREPRKHRPLAGQYEQWMAHLRRHLVSRRAFPEAPAGAAAGDFVLGSGSGSGPAAGAAVASAATLAGGFLVNGRHLSYGDDPRTQMWVGGQLFNVHTYNAVPPKSLNVWLDYGTDRGYGMTVAAEIRELISHVPVWDGQPGALQASRMLNADQFFVHAHPTGLAPGTEYHYRFRYATARENGATTDGTTYVVVGTAGTPRYGWTGGATDRNFAAGPGSGTTVTADAASKSGPWVAELDFSKAYETVDWSQARYDDYGFIALDVTPAPRGQRTTMTLRFINEQGRELDRVVFYRTAGESLPG